MGAPNLASRGPAREEEPIPNGAHGPGYDQAMRTTAGLLALAAGLLWAPPPAALAGDPAFDAAAKAVQKAAGEKEPGPLADALYALRSHDGEPAARLLLGAAFHREVPDFVLDAAMDALAHFESDAACRVFEDEASRAPAGPRRCNALEALGRLKSPRAALALVAAAADSDARTRTAALRALADRKEPPAEARGVAERALLDPDPRVRSAGIGALAEWKGIPSALPLLGALAREEGRLFGDAWAGLRRISGKDLGPAPKGWADWWRTQPDEEDWDFESPPRAPAASFQLAGLVSYSRRILFVIDTSEGMADVPGYRAAEMVPPDAAEDGARDLDAWKSIRTRLDHARCQVIRAIRRLPADAAFDVQFGNESSGAVFRSLQPASDENRDRAVGRLRGLSAAKRQDFARLVRGAWADAPEGDPLSPASLRDGADTIVYFGTALPSYGAELDPGRIVSSVRRWNRVRQVRFLGVGVGTHGSGLLADLASTAPVGGSVAIQ